MNRAEFLEQSFDSNRSFLTARHYR